MKKISKILLSILVVMGLTGCVKYNVSMGVNDDKSVDFEVIYAADIKVTESFNELSDDESSKETTNSSDDSGVKKEDYNWLSEKGYKVEDYKESTDKSVYVGVKISKTFKSIDDITKSEDKQIDINLMFDDKEKFDDSQLFSKTGNIYKANIIFDMSEDSEKNETREDDAIDTSNLQNALLSTMDLKYTVKLPTKALSNNATIVSEDGKTLTWILEYNKKNEIQYTFEIDENIASKKSKDSAQPTTGAISGNMTLYIVIGALAVVVIVLIVLLTRKKDKGNTINTSNVIVGETIPENAEETQAVEPKEISVEESIDEAVEEESNEDNKENN